MEDLSNETLVELHACLGLNSIKVDLDSLFHLVRRDVSLKLCRSSCAGADMCMQCEYRSHVYRESRTQEAHSTAKLTTSHLDVLPVGNRLPGERELQRNTRLGREQRNEKD